MDLQRTLLLGGLVIVGYLLWQAWQQDYAVEPTHAVQHAQETIKDTGVPTAVVPEALAPAQDVLNTLSPSSDWIVVETDVLKLWIDPKGGDLAQAELLDYKQTLEPNSPDIQLLSSAAQNFYVAQSGLSSEQGPDSPTTGSALYQTDKKNYQLQDEQDTLVVDLLWKDNQGLSVTKQFIFKRGQYLFDIGYELNNQSKKTWYGQFYGQFKRKQGEDPGLLGLATYQGAAISSPDKRYEKITYKEMSKNDLDRNIEGGWLAMLQHYFVSSFIPQNDQPFRYLSWTPENGVARIALMGPVLTAAPNESIKTGAQFYLGPKIAENLKVAAPHLELTLDYGWFWPISVALFWVMKKFHEIFSNWGVAIILVTLLVKIVFYKLSASSYRSMAHMRLVQPKIMSLRERFGSDKQKMSQAMIELYRKEKINPLGGCLPILIQIPVFIALYWVIIESVEFRHAPFIFWIHDLSAMDPYYILPIIMGISMLLQQKLSPPPPDPMQAKVLMFMPVLFTILFIAFPAGLVLYWVVNNLLSITQQYIITRNVEKAAHEK
ncbi:MAG: membrane protein insertase YidC [Legionellales bacterium]|jgi:YidC/Oxa1 family membrane protein insertase